MGAPKPARAVPLEIPDRSDGGDSAWESDIREAVHERSNHGRLGIAGLQARAAVRAELGRGITDRG